jgi:hypothetical protein
VTLILASVVALASMPDTSVPDVGGTARDPDAAPASAARRAETDTIVARPGPPRLDESPPRPAPARVVDRRELETMIADRVVLGSDVIVVVREHVDRRIRGAGRGCGAGSRCVIGRLSRVDGRPSVTADAALRSILDSSTEPVSGELVLRLRQGEVELLGVFDRTPRVGLERSVAAARRATEATAPGTVVAVDGWLVGSAGEFDACGPLGGRPPLPHDSPFRCLPDTWITAHTYQPITRLEEGAQITAPRRALAVQRHAYEAYARAPARDADGLDIPRRAAYLLRLVVDEWEGCRACRRWQVVGRLEP